MKIAVITEGSTKHRNTDVMKALEGMDHEVFNLGMCLACNNFFPKNVRLTGQEYNENTFNQYTTQAVARAAALGAKKIVFGSAAARNVPSDFSMEEAHKQIIERLSFIADVAEKNHVQIEIEHLNRLESNIINSFSESVVLNKATQPA